MLAHQGSIRVESALNRGCTFLLTLPVANRTAAVDPAAETNGIPQPV
jgi:signal transduction histidine kinase